MNRINNFQTPEEVTAVIENYIDSFEVSTKRERMALGVDYYRSENTEIMNRRKITYVEDDEGNPIAIDDPYKANNKLPAGYFKLLVDQKVNYLLGNKPTIKTDDEIETDEYMPDDWVQKLRKTAKEASKKAVGWLQPYISDGELKFKDIPSEQIIPVYRVDNNDKLEMVIRYYEVEMLNQDNEVVSVNRVEVWDDEQVTYYQQNTETMMYNLLTPVEMEQIFDRPYSNPKYHFRADLKFGDKVRESEGHSWGRVPFVPLYNNEEGDYDLQPVKKFIDAYDKVKSDLMNNLEDFQEAYWILKGYEGENLNEFLQQVKRYKTLKVGEGGDARAETLEVPYKARKEAKEGLEKDIFTFGMGVNPSELAGGNITNVVIKSRFANLDLKCDQFEDMIMDFLEGLIYFVNVYRELNNEPTVDVTGYNFDRSMIINLVEMADLANKSKGSLSEETRLANDPRIDNPQDEIERMNNETANYISLGEGNE